MTQVLALALVSVLALTAETEGATRKQRAAPNPSRAMPNQMAQEQDEFRWCDVAVRDFVQGRTEATALQVKEVKVDGLRMTLNFVHPYGESGDTPPNLGFTRGESIEERRKTLNETKLKIRTLAEAAKSGNVWYVIAVAKDNLEAGRGGADENRPSASAVVMASIDNKCVTISDYKKIPLDSLSDDLRILLGEKAREPLPAEGSAAAPPS